MTENQTITEQQAAQVSAALYAPTIRRMTILCQSLVNTTQNGDFALWAPLATMENVLAELRWTDATAPERFLSLITLSLRRMAEKCEVHQMAVIASRAAGAPVPEYPVWGDQDTIAVYDEIDARFPRPIAEPVDTVVEAAPAPELTDAERSAAEKGPQA
jgi:hypothetical protein